MGQDVNENETDNPSGLNQTILEEHFSLAEGVFEAQQETSTVHFYLEVIVKSPHEWQNSKPTPREPRPKPLEPPFRDELTRIIARAAHLGADEAIEVERIRSQRALGLEAPTVTFSVGFETHDSFERARDSTTLRSATIKGMIIDVRVPKQPAEGFRFGLEMFTDVNGKRITDPVFYLNLLVEQGINPRAFLLPPKRTKKSQDDGGQALGQWMDIYLDPQFCLDHGAHHDTPTIEPSITIEDPPSCFIYPSSESGDPSTPKQQRRLIKFGHCRWCWGEQHKKCAYFRRCKTCTSVLDDMPHKGHLHCCQLGILGHNYKVKWDQGR